MDKVTPDRGPEDVLDIIDILGKSTSYMGYMVSIAALLDEEVSARNVNDPHVAYALTEALSVFAKSTEKDLMACEKLLRTLDGGKKSG